MSTFDKLIQHIEQNSKKQHPFIVAISGFGGSGKSTLAKKIQAHFHIHPDQVLHTDLLYSQNPNGPHIFDQTNWSLVQQILTQAQNHQPLNYLATNSQQQSFLVQAPLPSILIIEGVRLLQPNLMPLFHLSIWINCPHHLALQRAKARDRAQQKTEEEISKWDSDWGPKDALYFQLYQPQTLASIVYEEYE